MWYLYMTSYTCTLNFINACENECTFITLDKEGQITTYPIISHHIISQTSIVQYMHKHKFLFNFYGTCICLMITKVNWVMRVRNSNGPIYFFITILYFLNDKACMSYDHGSLNRRTGGLCVIGELYALLLSHNSL